MAEEAKRLEQIAKSSPGKFAKDAMKGRCTVKNQSIGLMHYYYNVRYEKQREKTGKGFAIKVM